MGFYITTQLWLSCLNMYVQNCPTLCHNLIPRTLKEGRGKKSFLSLGTYIQLTTPLGNYFAHSNEKLHYTNDRGHFAFCQIVIFKIHQIYCMCFKYVFNLFLNNLSSLFALTKESRQLIKLKWT